jgi:hypothetical protein
MIWLFLVPSRSTRRYFHLIFSSTFFVYCTMLSPLDDIERNVIFKEMKVKCENSNSSNMENSFEKKRKENNIFNNVLLS